MNMYICIVIFFISVVLSLPAFSEPVHQVDMTQPLFDENEVPIKYDPSCVDDCKLFTLGDAIARVLYAQDKNLQPEEAGTQWGIAQRIRKDKQAILTPEELRVIKQQVGKLPPLLLGQVYTAIDPTWKPQKAK